MSAVGERVGAILSADADEVRLLGYGVYEGDFEAPSGPFGVTWEHFDELARESLGQDEFDRMQASGGVRPRNPRIRLDDGSVVWGQECWWGPEDRVHQEIGSRRVVMVDTSGQEADAAGTGHAGPAAA
jgi:hypothetical protein